MTGMTGNGPSGGPDLREVADLIAHITEDVQALESALRSVAQTNPASAFSEAGRLIDTLGKALETAGALRAHAAKCIHQTEALSLAGLAKRIGVSKARADQLVNPRPKPPKRKADQP
jgi:hypothetical protein